MTDKTIDLFKCLSDKSRLRIISNLMKGPMYVELLSESLNLASSTVSFHLKKLEAAGLVTSSKEQYYVVYKLNDQMLNQSLKSLLHEDDAAEDEEQKRQEEYRQNIIKNFFEYGKLKTIPVQRKKRQIILQEIAKAFEMDREYTEKEVNLIIADFHDDFCTLRREFIMERMFERENSLYRRIK